MLLLSPCLLSLPLSPKVLNLQLPRGVRRWADTISQPHPYPTLTVLAACVRVCHHSTCVIMGPLSKHMTDRQLLAGTYLAACDVIQ